MYFKAFRAVRKSGKFLKEMSYKRVEPPDSTYKVHSKYLLAPNDACIGMTHQSVPERSIWSMKALGKDWSSRPPQLKTEFGL